MSYYEFFISTTNPKLRIYCHTINSKLEKRLGLKVGTFVYNHGILIRVKNSDLELFNNSISLLAEILDSTDRVFDLGSKNIVRDYSKMTILMNYGKDNDEPEKPKFSLLNNQLIFSASQKLVLKGVQADKTLVNDLILTKKPYLRTEMVVYLHNNKEKRIPIQEFKVDLVGVKVTSVEELLELVVYGVGEKKSYGCGLVLL